MAIEIEAKMRVPDPARLAARLAELAGEAAADVVVTDAFFDSEVRPLRESDRGLRVRVEREAVGDAVRRAVVTYKGPREPGPIKRREQIEFTVSDAEQAAALLERLGYVEQVRYEKRRRSWRVGGCAVELDRVPYLGEFVEIEGPGDEAVMAVRRKLGLGEEPLIRESYIELLRAYLDEHGIAERRIALG